MSEKEFNLPAMSTEEQDFQFCMTAYNAAVQVGAPSQILEELEDIFEKSLVSKK